ncbi:MAG TPA: metallophosphoesterase, partial [Kineosporiaceae bacterium]|nr:metallophosphoesterase [Kineosporiaceae bacterium]
RLLLLADTHVPRRARDLPAEVWAEVDRADVVVHAGDWVEPQLLDALLERLERAGGDPRASRRREQPGRLLGVHGNNDGAELRRRLPEVARARLEGLELAVVHETGDARGRELRCDADPRFAGADLLVFGHSHIPWDTTTPRGLRLLNPGSPTDRRRQPACTYMTAVVEGARLEEVRTRRLPAPPARGTPAAGMGGRPAPGGRGAGRPPG